VVVAAGACSCAAGRSTGFTWANIPGEGINRTVVSLQLLNHRISIVAAALSHTATAHETAQPM
jgi:hypothetical protein